MSFLLINDIRFLIFKDSEIINLHEELLMIRYVNELLFECEENKNLNKNRKRKN